jgi:hypothetical protein
LFFFGTKGIYVAILSMGWIDLAGIRTAF